MAFPLQSLQDSYHKACGVRKCRGHVEFWFTLRLQNGSRHLVKNREALFIFRQSFTCITAWNPVYSYRNFKSCDDTGGRFKEQDMIVILDLGEA